MKTCMLALCLSAGLLFDLNGQVIPILDAGTHTRIEGLLPTSDKTRVISIGEEEIIKVIDVQTAEITQVFTTRTTGQKNFNRISTAALAPDDNTLAVGGNFGDDQAAIWIIDLKNQQVLHRFEAHPGGVRSLAFSGDGKLLASGGKDNLVKLWDAQSWQLKATLPGHQGFIFELCFSPDGEQLSSIAVDGKIILWQKEKTQFNATNKIILAQHTGIPLSFSYSPDGQYMVSAGLDGKVLLWDRRGTMIQQLYQSPNYFGNQISNGAAIFSPDGKYILFKEDLQKLDGFQFLIHIYSLQFNRIISTFKGHKDLILRTAYLAPDLVISAAGGNGSTLLWEPSSGRIIKRWSNAGATIFNLAFGKDLKMGLNQNVQDKAASFNFQFDWKKLELSRGSFNRIDFLSPADQFNNKKLQVLDDNKTISVFGDKNISLDMMQDGRIQQAAFSKEGEVIATCDYVLKIFGEGGMFQRELKGFSGELRTSSLSPDGFYLSTSGTDGVVRLWDYYTGQLLASLFVDKTGEWVCFLPTGFYTSSENGHPYLKIYQQDPQTKQLIALSPEEQRGAFYKPEKVRNAILTRSLEEKVGQADQLPEIQLPTPIPEFTAEKKLLLRGEVSSAQQIQQLSITNDRTKEVIKPQIAAGQQNMLINEMIPLLPGENQISLVGKNRENQIILQKEWTTTYEPAVKLIVSPGHSELINKLEFSPNGRFYASASNDLSIKLWDTNSGKLIASFDNSNYAGEVGAVDVAFSNDNQYLATIAGTNGIVIYDLHTLEIVQVIKDPEILTFDQNKLTQEQFLKQSSGISKLSFSKDGRSVIFNDPFGNIKFWDIQANEQRLKLPLHQAIISDFIITQDEKYLVSIGLDQQLIVWDLRQQKLFRQQRIALPFSEELKTDLSSFHLLVTPENDKIICANQISPECQVFNFFTGELTKKFTLSTKSNYITGLSITSEGKVLAVGSVINPVQLLDLEKYEAIKTLDENESELVTALSFHPNNNLLLTAHDVDIDQNQGVSIKLWNLDSGKLFQQTGNNVEQIRTLAISHDGQYLIGGSKDNNLQFWHTSQLREAVNETLDKFCNSGTGTFDLAFHPDNEQFVSAHCDGSVMRWQFRKNRLSRKTLFESPEAVRTLAFSKDGKYLVCAGSDKMIRIFDFSSGDLVRTLTGHSNPIGKIQFSHDGRYLASADYYYIHIWNWETGTLLKSIPIYFKNRLNLLNPQDTSNYDRPPIHPLLEEMGLQYTYNFVFSPDDKFLLVGGDNTGMINHYAIATGKQSVFKDRNLSPGKYLALAVSPDQKYLFAGHSSTGIIEVLELKSGKLIRSLKGHQKGVNDIVFANNGTICYTTSNDGTIKQWNWETGELILSFFTGKDGESIIFTPDNYYYCNKESVNNLAFGVEYKLYAFDQFDLFFNRPDIISERLGIQDQEYIDKLRNARLRRLKRLDLDPNLTDINFFNIPEVAIISAPDSRTFDQKELELRIKASSPTSPLDRINLFINEVPVYGNAGYPIREKKANQLEQSLTIPLSAGENNIQVSVHNNDGIESLRKNIYLNCTASAKKPNLYLVGLGVSSFADTSFNLRYASKDVHDFVQLFASQSDIYDQVFVDTLLNHAFRTGNLEKVKEKLRSSQIDDHVIIFIANHGILDNQYNYYFPTHKTDFGHPETSAIPYQIVENLLDGIPARKKLFVIDACHSGEIDKEDVREIEEQIEVNRNIKFRDFGKTIAFKDEGKQNSFEIMKDLFPDLRRGTGAQVISSASGVEFAIEGDQWQNGVFTYCLLKGLKEKLADLDKDGKITVSELQKYVSKEVSILTNGQQRPTMRIETATHDWQIW